MPWEAQSVHSPPSYVGYVNSATLVFEKSGGDYGRQGEALDKHYPIVDCARRLARPGRHKESSSPAKLLMDEPCKTDCGLKSLLLLQGLIFCVVSCF